MFLVYPHPQRLSQPIGIHATLDSPQFLVIQLVHLHLAYRRPRCGFIPSRQSFELQLLPSVHQIITRQIRHRQIHVPVITYLQFPRFRLHGFHHDHPVCRLRPVNGCRSRIFQNRDRRHPVNIQVINCRQRRLETVQYKKRLIRVGIQFIPQPQHTRLPPNLHVRQPVRV